MRNVSAYSAEDVRDLFALSLKLLHWQFPSRLYRETIKKFTGIPEHIDRGDLGS
jgi:hypothetical protein